MEEPPANPAEDPAANPSLDLDNTHVPDFTVDLLGGGRFSWSQQKGTPVVLAVGTVDQVTGALRRLAPVVPASSSEATLAGLVAELDQPKGRPRPIAEVERDAGRLTASVGFAADPTPAVWFFDSASNVGQVADGWESGLIAFVDSSGAVRRFLPMGASTGELQAVADALR
jgi:hypothetical protein